MTSRPAVAAFAAAARRLGDHPHDHGWRELYRLFAYGLTERPAPQLTRAVDAARAHRPGSSDEHLVTLLGIAVRSVAGATIEQLAGAGPAPARLARLEELLARHRPGVDQLVAQRQNSFTGARRFLLPQVLLAAYFAGRGRRAHVADLGTGLGLLPRQLNSPTLFRRFARELVWPERQPAYRSIPIGSRYGVDRGPLPDLAWVRTCYGPSHYYDAQFRELVEALSAPEVRAARVEYAELDITSVGPLRRFLTDHRVNAVNLSYTLYQLAPATRARVLDVLADSLAEPGVVIVTEPRQELAGPGCTVTVRNHAHPVPLPVCSVSDGHFRGRVSLLAGFGQFTSAYPVSFEPAGPPSRVLDAAPPGHATG